ncbi:hypothetical protein BU14_0237s0009 [Porphyra umbilicalis]|uniref:RRM domain-containing protein n=1 Tax=Porphyra umbilicalis TaxID=2786 RepID=A0A1X6P3R1_PORUM|nr:hypothetical protein BU14_0237s0009 [Porphyra umbilicalis]|eukprot:OSX75416.1 hypothetical protein BU14_0237s0009 [Porphyra umbilicalis]
MDGNDGGDGPVPARSVEGWVLFVSGLHAEATEEDLVDAGGAFGPVARASVVLDRRTGYAKGYGLLAFASWAAAAAARGGLAKDMGGAVSAEWAFLGGGGGGKRRR